MRLMYSIPRFSAAPIVLVLSVALMSLILPYRNMAVHFHLNMAHLQFIRAVELPEWFTPNSIPIIRYNSTRNSTPQHRLRQALAHLKAVTETYRNAVIARAYQLTGQIEILLLDWNDASLAYRALYQLAPDTTLRTWEKVFLLPLETPQQPTLPVVVEAKDLLESADIAFRYQQFAVASKYYELAALNEWYQKTHRIDYEDALSESTSYLLFQYLLSSALSDNKNVERLILMMKQRQDKFEVIELFSQMAPISVNGWKFFWLFNGSPVNTNNEVGYLWSPHFATILVNVSDDGVYALTPEMFAVEANSVQTNLFIDGELFQQFEAYANKNLALQPITIRVHLTKGFHITTLQTLPDPLNNVPRTGAIKSLRIKNVG